MAVPVIDSTQSIQSLRVGVPVSFGPFATNTPTSWAASGLPTGLSIDSDTGVISGTPTAAGVFVSGVTATNGDGTSAVQKFYFGVETGSESDGSGLSLSSTAIKINVLTGEVIIDGEGLFATQGSDLILDVLFLKGEAPATLDISAMQLRMEKYEPDAVLIASEADKFRSMDDDAYWQVFCPIEGDAVEAALADEENDAETFFTALAQLSWTEDIAGWTGVTAKRGVSRIFPIKISRKLA